VGHANRAWKVDLDAVSPEALAAHRANTARIAELTDKYGI